MGKDTSEYDVQELILSSEQTFGVKKECAAAALQLAKVTKATKKEANDIINKFMRKEVI